ncbi:MAG: hypothetical protein WEB63_11970 [Cucumibacter sp.]
MAIADGGTGASTAAAAQTNLGIPASIPGYLWGLTLANNTGDAANDIDIAAGVAVDSTNARNITLASGLTKRLDAAWSVGTNQGGLDTGAVADTTYHVWLILRSDSGVVDVLFSTSAPTPTMPANYDFKRRIGSIIRQSGTIRAFRQSGDSFALTTQSADSGANNPGTSAVTLGLTVPLGIVVHANVAVTFRDNSAGSINFLLLTALDEIDSVPSFNLSTQTAWGISEWIAVNTVLVKTNTSGQIRYRLGASNTDVTVYISTVGWIDTRGRLA